MNTFLHLGAHKTGTSLIQKYMKDNRELMHLNSIGFTKRSETNKSINWGSPEFLKANIKKLTKSLDDYEKRRFRAFVISHENSIGRVFKSGVPGLYPDRDASLEALSQYLSAYDVTVIYYIRSQEQFLESYYLQTIHEGSYKPFAEWLSGIDTQSLSWAPVVRSLEATFGKERVVICDFATEISGGQSACLRSFFDIVRPGLSPLRFRNFDYAEVKNPSVGDKGLAMALAANHLLENLSERRAMRKFLQSRFSNIDYPRPILLDAETKAALKARHAEENAALITRKALPPLPQPGLLQRLTGRLRG
jgi:hypothetical protein